jgi:NAD(P)-dependent dehydrogenase (short-subunit alcohol dehydrogenase family)
MDAGVSHGRTRESLGAVAMKAGDMGMSLHGRIHQGSWMHGNGLMGTSMKAHGCTGAAVRRPPEARGLVATAVEKLGGIDILINNAAIPGGASPANHLGELVDEHVIEDFNVKVIHY